MGFFSKLFGDNNQMKLETDNTAQKIADLINCDYQALNDSLDSESVMRIYVSEIANGQENGYVPLIVVSDKQILDMFECYYSNDKNFANDRERLLATEVENGKEFLKERFKNYIAAHQSTQADIDIYGHHLEKCVTSTTFLNTNKHSKLLLFRIPTDVAWKVFAWIPFGGWDECPDTECVISVCKYWYEKYKAIPAVISGNEIQMYIPSPPTNADLALEIAEEQFAFCNDIVYQGVGSIKALASTILNSNVWYFWWD